MADLYSPAVFGRARNVENASEAEAHMQAHLQAALINARMQRDLAHFKGDAAGEADWQRNIDWLSGVLADHETRVYQARVTAEKLLAIPSTGDGRSVDDQLHDEAASADAERHHADLAAIADTDEAEAEEAHRQGFVEARIRRLERDDRAERLASQALAIVERRR